MSRQKAPISVDYLPTAGLEKDWRQESEDGSLASAAKSLQRGQRHHLSSSSYPALERLKAAGRRLHRRDDETDAQAHEEPRAQAPTPSASDLAMIRQRSTPAVERPALPQKPPYTEAPANNADEAEQTHAPNIQKKDGAPKGSNASWEAAGPFSHGADHFMTGGAAPLSSPSLVSVASAAGHGADHFGTGGVAPRGMSPSVQSLPDAASATPSQLALRSVGASERGLDDGRFCRKSLIARGGMGEVWRAWDQQEQRWVALKYIHPNLRNDDEVRRRFVREQDALERLKHKHIVRFYEADPQRGLLVMEWVKGPTLRSQLQAQGRLSVWEAIEVGLQIGEALQEAHKHHLIHRDLKPSNIILCQTGSSLHCKLLDFGVAAALDATRVTRSLGGIVGTAYYIDPAQRERGIEAQPAFDVYSLGVLLYEMLAGDVPFANAASLSEIFRQLDMAGHLEPIECPDEMKKVFFAQIKELESLYLSAVTRDRKRRISLGHWLLVLRGIRQKLRLARDKGLRTRLEKVEHLQKQDQARALRRCLEDAICAYPDEDSFARLLAQLDQPVPSEVASIYHGLNGGKTAFEVLDACWRSYQRRHPRPGGLISREIDEILQEREDTLEALLAEVEECAQSKGPTVGLRILLRRPMASRRWDETKVLLERSAQNLETLLANTRKRLARGTSIEQVPQYWREQLRQKRLLPPWLLGSSYVLGLLGDFLKTHELYDEVIEDLLLTERERLLRSGYT